MNADSPIKSKVITDILEKIEQLPTTDKAALCGRFTRQFFSSSKDNELAREATENHYGSLIHLWNWIQRRQPGAIAIKVYNPNNDVHGWQSSHTIVDILTDDTPFLVASVSNAMTKLGIGIHKLNHPVLRVVRDEQGQLQKLLETGESDAKACKEALIRFEIDYQIDSADHQQIADEVLAVVNDVYQAIDDWSAMLEKLNLAIDNARSYSAIPAEELDEDLSFLQWLADDNFLFLGFRSYQLKPCDEGATLRLEPGSGLGTFRTETEQSRKELSISSRLLEQWHKPSLLMLTKSTDRSTVQRNSHLDYIGIKRFDDQGNLNGEWRFFGLFSSKAYLTPIEQLPIVRRKIATVWQNFPHDHDSYSGKTLRHVINHYPRDEMVLADQQQLQQTLFGIVECQERRQLRVFVRPDALGRFFTVLIYAPRDRYNTELREEMQRILLEQFDGHSAEFDVQLSGQLLAQIQFTIHSRKVHQLSWDEQQIEKAMSAAMLSWEDKLQQALTEALGEARANQLSRDYNGAYPAAYKEEVSARSAVADLSRLQQLSEQESLITHLYRDMADQQNLHFRVFGRGKLLALSEILPILEQMGVKVMSATPYQIRPQRQAPSWILDLHVMTTQEIDADQQAFKSNFQQTFERCYRGEIENDGFNALVLTAGLSWRQVILLRAISKYLLQLAAPFSQAYMQDTLNGNPAISAALVELFELRFDPSRDHSSEVAGQQADVIEGLLEQVANLDQDRIMRHFLSVIQAMLRTNFYQLDQEQQIKGHLSFKIAPELIPVAPMPRPKYEIFVYAPWVEGVHMRGGKVARGGLRWSDRREDFRTEVLGLVKAQMVKNAVIVPLGAKGGFFPKQLPEGDREAIQAEVIHSYKTFISGLLDITDNLVNGELVPPAAVVRYDDDDPYLVVAADKGTATFSDIANEISLAYGFWLGDAFASGGSQGYDHKKMGITARGAWESVKRLFREQGIDTQSTDFTVVGIGDMAGDVFGNGMLLSEHIQLVAAFNHMHIFVDPTPDAATSYRERQRLFNLPRSSWEDYNRELISKGGGIFSRSAKSIKLSPQMRKALDTAASELTPNELIQAILKAPVDLLWNGGIGTYIKATAQTHLEVGDRNNDAVRLSASEVRVKVIGEGGNLGLTQQARIELARMGCLLNTDAIDNSAGVDSSDHEVNIKILVDSLVSNGELTSKQRNQLLASMTDEVAELVLNHNQQQCHLLSLTSEHSARLIHDHRHLMTTLEQEGRLNRQIEDLPDDSSCKELAKSGQGLTRPEIAVLLAYSKLRVNEHLVQQGAAEDPYLSQLLPGYFPKPLRQAYLAEMASHPLRSEIICTLITNHLGNRMGETFCHYIENETNADTLSIVRAYTAAKAILGIEPLWQQLDRLGLEVDDAQQRKLYLRIIDLLERTTIWLLNNHALALDIDNLIETYRPGIEALKNMLPQALGSTHQSKWSQSYDSYRDQGLTDELSRLMTELDYLYQGLDIIWVAQSQQQTTEATVDAYFALESELQLPWLQQTVAALPESDLWQRKARAALANELRKLLRSTTAKLLTTTDQPSLAERIHQWQQSNQAPLSRCQRLLAELQKTPEPNLAMLSVAVRELGSLSD